MLAPSPASAHFGVSNRLLDSLGSRRASTSWGACVFLAAAVLRDAAAQLRWLPPSTPVGCENSHFAYFHKVQTLISPALGGVTPLSPGPLRLLR